MHDVDAFLSGMKPAFYGNTGSPTCMENIYKLQQYPCITKGIDIFDGPEFFLFFQTEKMKAEFENQVQNIPPRSPAFHRLLGITLGYPPKAAAFYAACQENEQYYDYSIGIMYGGVRCVSHVDDLIENASWLWNRYTDDIDLRIQTGGNHHPVDRYDLERLHEFQLLHKKREAAAV
jgi:hypothetical protein